MPPRPTPQVAAWDRTVQALRPGPPAGAEVSAAPLAFADALDAARLYAAGTGGGDVVVHDRDGREIWREHVDARGAAHPVRAPR